MKSITVPELSFRRAIAILYLLIAGVGFSTKAQSPDVSSRPSDPSSQLQFVFYGYPELGVSRSGAAVITEKGLSNIHEVAFLRAGGELSPDGRLIAYDNCQSPGRGIYIAELDGKNSGRVISLDGECVQVRWSPDGTKLSYDSHFELHVLDLTTKQEQVLKNTDVAGWHSWSPNGDEIVYERGTGKTGRLLYITDLHGKNRQLTFAGDFSPCELAFNLIDTWAPDWSPNGDQIVFTECGSLFLISPNGQNLRQLTSFRDASLKTALPKTPGYAPRWSPDGRSIYFIGQFFGRPGKGEPLKRISLEDGVVVDVGMLPYAGAPFSIAPLRR